jgi:hypothetical protein
MRISSGARRQIQLPAGYGFREIPHVQMGAGRESPISESNPGQSDHAGDRRTTCIEGSAKEFSDDADLIVIYQAAVDQEKQWNSYSTDMGGGWGYGRWGGWGGYGGGMSTTTTTSETINIGTINVDIYDVTAKNQVWRGAASKTLGSGKDPAKVNKNLNKAMRETFQEVPTAAEISG